VLSDGQQFRCRQAFEGQTLTARVLVHTKGCVRLRSLVLSPAVRRMIAALDKARTCLTAKGLRALGGPVLPAVSRDSSSADGELVVGSSAAHAVFIAFYTDAARAQRLQASLMRNGRRQLGGRGTAPDANAAARAAITRTQPASKISRRTTA
jgi:hypothetical protein